MFSSRSMTLVLPTLCVLLLLSILSPASCQAQQILTEGNFVNIAPSNSITYFQVNLHSYKTKGSVTVPPMLIAWTNLSMPAGQDQATNYPTIWTSWLDSNPSPTSYNFTSTTGVVEIPGDQVAGQYQIFITVDLTGASTPTPYSIGYNIFAPIQLSACPSRGQLSFAAATATTQFVTQIPAGTDVTFHANSFAPFAMEDNDEEDPIESAPIFMYISTVAAPSRSNYMWTTMADTLVIPQTDPNFPKNGVFFLGVYSLSNDCRIFVSVNPTTCPSQDEGEVKIAVE